MRYFLDSEYNGFGGSLISLALVPEHGDQEFYAILPLPERIEPWVERHVLPFLHMVPVEPPEPMQPAQAAGAVATYLRHDPDAVIVADWPDDIGHFCFLLSTGPGEMAEVGPLRFQLLNLAGFSTAANSRVPHNALHDARALRTFVLGQERLLAER